MERLTPGDASADRARQPQTNAPLRRGVFSCPVPFQQDSVVIFLSSARTGAASIPRNGIGRAINK